MLSDQSADHCSGGLLIWGSNPAILWTATRDEEAGVHAHAYMAELQAITNYSKGYHHGSATPLPRPTDAELPPWVTRALVFVQGV